MLSFLHVSFVRCNKDVEKVNFDPFIYMVVVILVLY